jgi:hypothetical protein
MQTIESHIKSNQRDLLTNRRTIAKLRTDQGFISLGRAKITEDAIADFIRINGTILRANAMLRKHRRDA